MTHTLSEPLPSVCIRGRITWLDILGNEHPLADTLVELTAYKDGMSVGAYTDDEGRYSIDMEPETPVQDYNLYLHTKTRNCYVSSAKNVMRPYYVQLFKYKQLEPGTVIEGQDKQIDTGQKVGSAQELNKLRAFSIAQAINVGHDYVHRIDHVHSAHDVTHLCYPNRNASKTSYCAADGSYLSIYDSAFCAWDILLHEFGHWLQSRYEFLDTPGGSHASSADDIEALGNKDEGIRQAWCESWPTVFAILSTRYLNLQGFPYVNDMNYDANNTSGDSFWNYSLEDEDRDRLGEGCERSIMQVLFEMHVPQEEGLNLSDEVLWRLVTQSRVATFSQFVSYALGQGVDAVLLGESLSRHGMAARDLTYSAEQKMLQFVLGGNPRSVLSLQDVAWVRGIHPISHEILFELPAQVEGTLGRADLSAVEWPAEGLGLQVISQQSHAPVTGPYPSQCLVVPGPEVSASTTLEEENTTPEDELIVRRCHFDAVRKATTTLRSCCVTVGGQQLTLKTKGIRPLADAVELTPGAELHLVCENPVFGLCAEFAATPDRKTISQLSVEYRQDKGKWSALDAYADYGSVEAMCEEEVKQFRIVLSKKADETVSVRLTQILLFGY